MKPYISNYKLETNKINDFKIAHISDIHFHKTFDIKKFEIIKNSINNLKPNYICITGDLIDEPKVINDEFYYNLLVKFLKDLENISKVIVTLGNHEMRSKNYDPREYSKVLEKIKKIDNIIVLDNEVYVDNNIKFIGYNPTYEYYYEKGRKDHLLVDDFNKYNFKIDSNKYNILLIHTPKNLLEDDIYLKINNFNKIDLILSGHTHGGMMPNGFFGHFGIISPGKLLFPKNVRGIIKRDDTTLIISSGITRLSHSAHLFRLFNDVYKMNIVNITINNIKHI